MSNQEIITRGLLPHWYVPGAAHFVTYRLAGTIPQAVLENLQHQRQARLGQRPPAGTSLPQFQALVHKQMFAAYDHYLDQVCRLDWLARPQVAAMIRENLYHHNSHKYHLLAYCIMANHVHVLFQPIISAVDGQPEGSAETAPPTADVISDEVPDGRSPLAGIMHSLKSYTANQANLLLGRSGQFWQHESYDHWVRDEEELERIVDYIAANPVKAGLVEQPCEWFFGSAHDRFLHDGASAGFLLP